MFNYKSTFDVDSYLDSFFLRNEDTTKFLDKFETENEYIYGIPVPYFSANEINVEFDSEKSMILITGKTQVYGTKLTLDKKYYISENYTSKDISTQLIFGVLFIKLPKTVSKKKKEITKIQID